VSFRNRKGEPISLEEFARLVSDESYRRLAADAVGEASVITIWNGMNPYAPLGTGPQFSSITVRRQADVTEWGAEEWYETEELALAGHKRRVRTLQLGERIATVARDFLHDEEPT
jgi:hypothetical protein